MSTATGTMIEARVCANPGCHNKFVPKHPANHYCSDECRDADTEDILTEVRRRGPQARELPMLQEAHCTADD